MVLVHEHDKPDFTDICNEDIYTYGHKIVGFCIGDGVFEKIKLLAEWFFNTSPHVIRIGLCGRHNIVHTEVNRLLALKTSWFAFADRHSLDCAHHERILVDDILDYYRDLIRLGEDSRRHEETGRSRVTRF